MSKQKKNRLVFSTRPEADTSRNQQAPQQQASVPPQQQTIRVTLDRKRRRGKTVTVAGGFQLTPADLKQLQKELKQLCGAGGTCKDDEIEIQGDHRDKIIEALISRRFKAKAAGG